MVTSKTESGDRYTGTSERWVEYRNAVNEGNWEHVMKMEEGEYEDFFYDPQ